MEPAHHISRKLPIDAILQKIPSFDPFSDIRHVIKAQTPHATAPHSTTQSVTGDEASTTPNVLGSSDIQIHIETGDSSKDAH